MAISDPGSAEGGARADDTCAACVHSWSEHDALGVRYCTATTTFTLVRGCICGG
ncbi:RGCVC family protein [Lentzea sp. NBRC 105346]|uniref:RGCVC family protein n=1 Tax=Lentzea sp. NBRC 105346 TaxID=3032205 RepID=UPI002556BD24|nr:RGCVC family protein [Lentzea sp. NBRC 105346]